MIIKKNERGEQHAHINKRENKREGERRRDKGKRTERVEREYSYGLFYRFEIRYR